MVTLATAVLCLSLQGAAPAWAQAHPFAVNRLQIAESWDDLSPSQRDRALRNYQHYLELPAEKKHDMDQRYEKWKKMPRTDQEHLRRKHDEYRGMGLVGD
jgi:hypothetical protein